MRTINKGVEPVSLTSHRCTDGADYDNYHDKDALRQSLAAEQRGICCYCMSRIHPAPDHMKIEHWHCQDTHPDEQLIYSNMLASCTGGEGNPRKRQHCDTHKRNDDLSRNPANPSHRIEDFIHYTGDGAIRSDNADFNRELNNVLNLNTEILKNNRKAKLTAFTMTLDKRGSLQRPTLERLLSKWNGDSDTAELEPYCQVVVYWLRKRLRRV